MVSFDGRTWEDDKCPNLGSFKPISIVSSPGEDVHVYSGLSKDIDKLPTYVGTGSIAECIDTSEIYKFEETTKTWYKNTINMVGISPYVIGTTLFLK